MNTNPSAPKDTTKTKLDNITTNTTLISNLTKQNLRLSGEVAILRQNLITLERENYNLNATKNIKLLSSFKTSEKLKKEVNILKTENQMNENRLRAFKKPKTIEFDNTDYKWLFSKINSEIQFKLWPIDIKRLKILNGYFYDDFEQILSIEGVEDEIRQRHKNFEEMCTLFLIFSARKSVFDKLFKFIFEIYFECKNEKYAGKVYYILCYCELDWILGFVENDVFMKMLNEFLDITTNEEMAIIFYARIIREKPVLLNIFLDTNRFQRILENEYAFIDNFLELIPDSNFRSYINVKNIRMVDKKFLKKVYGNDYFEIF